MRYINSLDYLSKLNSMRIRLGLDRIRRLLKRLNHPQKRYATVVIGGTNGKGSIAAMTASMLSMGGFRTGLYTSPHLIDVRERIRIDGHMISREEMQACIEEVKRQVTDDVTYFEFLTAAAFLYFDCRQVDVAVLEVGMGGRLDATNVTEPAVSVVSNIALDHLTYLGTRLEDIAREKIGIIKPGISCVTAVRQKHIVKMLEEACLERKTRLYRLGKDIKVRNETDGIFSFKGIHKDYNHLSCPLKGRHQIDNAALAVGTVALLSEKGFRLENNAIYQGLKDTHWEGRLEILQKRPVVLIDAAHNPAGIGALCDTLKTQFSYRRLIVIFGVLNDKDYKNMLRKMAPLVQHLIITRPDSSRSLSPEKIFMIAQQYHCETVIVEKPDEALHQALVEAGPDDLICITGSVYLIGEIKRVYQKVHREK